VKARTPLNTDSLPLKWHRIAEYGVAVHWRYKEAARKMKNFMRTASAAAAINRLAPGIGGAEEFLGVGPD